MPAPQLTPWKIWVDTGGTFTDCIAFTPAGKIKRLKILSSSVIKAEVRAVLPGNCLAVEVTFHTVLDIFKNFSVHIPGTAIALAIHHTHPDKGLIYLKSRIPRQIKAGTRIEITSHEEVPVLAARLLTETPLHKKFPPIEMKLGSTRGTNALLERKGAPTALIITKGFKDLLRIGTQQRPDLFALHIVKEEPLYKIVLETDERMNAAGNVLVPLSPGAIPSLVKKIKEAGCTSVAIALLHSYKNPAHEKTIKQALLAAGLNYVTASHEISEQIKILPRAETAVANAYLAPVIHAYLHRVQSGLAANLKIMTSAGGLVSAQKFFPKDSLLSGPAGGVVGAAISGARSGMQQLIAFDMGGTSTDVSLFNKAYSYRYESKVGHVRILSPSLEIETIAAGGGSICDFDGYKLIVGPHSAGAAPGPACYGAGGPLTITDVNLLLGRIASGFFAVPLYRDPAKNALEKILEKIYKHTGKRAEPEQVLESFLQIANEKMAEAIRKVSVQQGHNPADYTLLSFGGAGGQHASALAHLLGSKKILVPYDAGLLSAYGIGHADITHFEEQLVLKPLAQAIQKWEHLFTRLKKQGFQKLVRDGYAPKEITIQKQIAFLRFKGQESCIEVDANDPAKLISQFKLKYKAIYGHWLPHREIEIESVRLVAVVKGYQSKTRPSRIRKYTPASQHKQQMHIAGKWINADVFQWEKLMPGAIINGPALVVSQNSTTVVPPAWQFRLDRHNHALLHQSKKQKRVQQVFAAEAALELFSNRFTAVAQEMGALLQRTSFSVNVKERLDFSCALLDANGYLIVNAPHIPVHLGSMGVCVREVMKSISIREGDVIITNHPAYGGSHLPDITLIKPVFVNKKRVGFVANRAHHAEIGGTKPGSMPANATTLTEEGVIIAPIYLVKHGKPQWIEIKKLFTEVIYPTRLIDENLADLNGALASVNTGELLLKKLCRAHGTYTVLTYMKALQQYAAQQVSEKIKSLQRKTYAATERLDDGRKLHVTLTREKDKLVIDFTGSADVHPGNLNATHAIVQSVILYVLRVWINKPIAMNEGLMQHIRVVLPQGILNPDFKKQQPAVVGGNTEVSQRLTDTLMKALELSACSQGTMNNFLFGNTRFGFYETICGGAGASPGYNGADAVHTHMTNTRITDAEILEHRYPVLLKRFEIRKSSGGKGKWRGGNGVIREVQFNESMEVNLLTQHRVEAPYGMAGGKPGKRGTQHLIRANGEKIQLAGLATIEVNAGDKIVIATPGGGGWGNTAPQNNKGM
ncbi:MAG: hydantoinase B/oxoprolinase family protein [Cyclobacteriaceae bacterium]|nr:hydantoinase B/oxoprolinase family protein [Cyclobacteriaceae bacterium]